ncbi:class I SAM-dependent methyltransferase [uncultured Microscilla sp.]|uniref:class I SAM-dependent methyltransferase n=1 Tax=uncultured Microscilla sp. TaxID=432653 RepID=UPI002634BDA1|nr:class I SAM-dependent methyltransferase [uncultured Microscilla sp.]
MQTTFAQSPIWQLERQYFEEVNLGAWQQNEVPHYITSNPYMAKTYAHMIMGMLRDSLGQHDTDEPLYVVELGAGHGRFSFHVLRELSHQLALLGIEQPPLVYVMTDFVEEMLKAWEENPRLQPFVEAGLLDFARFDITKDTALFLRKAHRAIMPGSMRRPLVVTANYLFDCVPQDLFYFDQGQAYQVLTTLKNYDPEATQSAREQLKNIDLEYAYEAIDGARFDNPTVQKVFDKYKDTLQDSHLLFPEAGMQGLERLKALSPYGMLLLTADKGSYMLQDWQQRPAPYLASHGCFSLTVNFHALGQHCQALQGEWLTPTLPPHHINVLALLYLRNPLHYTEVISNYDMQVADFGPEGYYSIKKHIEKQIPDLAAKDLFAYLQLSHYDARLFSQFLPRLHQLAEHLNPRQSFALLHIIAQVWDGYYPLGEALDLAYHISTLLVGLGFAQEAMQFVGFSEELYGTNESNLFMRAFCHYALEQPTEAHEVLQKLLGQNPHHESAKQLMQELMATQST